MSHHEPSHTAAGIPLKAHVDELRRRCAAVARFQGGSTHYLEEAEALCNRIAMLKAGKVIALDSTSALLKNASGNMLCFKLDAELPLELAQKARVTGRMVQIPASTATDVEAILAQVRLAGLNAQEVEIRKADLEDVFLDLMSSKDAK